MTDLGPYARLYLSLVDDDKFAAIYGDDRHFAAWCRLLMIAEPAWPASAHLPGTARRASVQALSDAGLIDLLPGGRYRIHGLDAERERRHDQAKRASYARWSAQSNAPSNAPSNAGASTPPMPSQAKPSRAEPSPAEPSRDPADAYWSLTGRYPTDKTIGWIDELAGKYGQDATTRALVQAFRADKSPATLLGRVQDLLRADARALDRAEADAERQRLREKRALPKPITGPDAEFRAMLEARYAAQGIERVGRPA